MIFDVEEQRRRTFSRALNEAQLALRELEKEHDVKAVEAELADIHANADAREGAAARRELIRRMIEFDADILRPGTVRWTDITQLGTKSKVVGGGSGSRRTSRTFRRGSSLPTARGR